MKRDVEPTLVSILDDISLAGAALKRLPPERLPRRASCWPPVIHDPRESYGFKGDPEYGPQRFDYGANRQPASQEEIAALDKLLDWLFWLNPEESKVVVMRSFGMSWRAIGRRRRALGERNSNHETCRRIFGVAVATIYDRLLKQRAANRTVVKAQARNARA